VTVLSAFLVGYGLGIEDITAAIEWENKGQDHQTPIQFYVTIHFGTNRKLNSTFIP
jgi:hypothetical protein